MEQNRRIINPSLFGLIFICFAMPFVTVSCEGHSLATISGYDLVIPGREVMGEIIGPSLLAIIILLIAFAGLLWTVRIKNLDRFFCAIIAGAGLLLTLILRIQVGAGLQSKGEGYLTAQWESGYYFTLILFLILVVYNAFLWAWAPIRSSSRVSVSMSNSNRVSASTSNKGSVLPEELIGNRKQLGKAVDYKACPQCGSGNETESIFCRMCGYKMPPEATEKAIQNSVVNQPRVKQQEGSGQEQSAASIERYCPHCGKANTAEGIFCWNCGCKIPATDETPSDSTDPAIKNIPTDKPVKLPEELLETPSLPPNMPADDNATQLLQVPVIPVLKSITDNTLDIVPIDKPEFIIGRDPDKVDYFIDNNNNIGRTHAKIITQEGHYYIIDLDSKNGTYINDNKVESGVQTAIKFGDMIKLANLIFTFDRV